MSSSESSAGVGQVESVDAGGVEGAEAIVGEEASGVQGVSGVDDAEPADMPIEMPAPAGDGTETVGAFAFALMRAQYWTMRAHEPAVRFGDDPEDLHAIRVAIRRLRAALVVFGDALPARASSLRERLGRVGSLLGAVRDLDVQLERVAKWSACADASERETLDALTAVLEDRRAHARKRVRGVLGSTAFQRLLESFELFLSRGASQRAAAARVPVLELAPELLGRVHRRVLRVGDHIEPASPPEALHALRIRCKRLRYAVEFFEPAYGKRARRYVNRLTAVQDLLGAHQDAVVAAATLRAVALDGKRPFEAAQILTVGGLIERCRMEGAAARSRLPKLYGQVAGAPWRKLVQVMEEKRQRAAEAAEPSP